MSRDQVWALSLKSVLDFSHDDRMPEISTYKDKDIFRVGFGVSSPCLVGSVALSNGHTSTHHGASVW